MRQLLIGLDADMIVEMFGNVPTAVIQAGSRSCGRCRRPQAAIR